jgi:hypothetical protein
LCRTWRFDRLSLGLFGRAGSPDCSAARGPDALSTVAAWWGQFRGLRRLGGIAAVGRARRGPADPPMSGVRAGARTATQVKFATRAAGRGSRAGRRTGPARVSWELAYPRARAASRVSRAAGGVLTGPWPAPAAGLGRAGRARATRTTPPPELRAGRRGWPGPVSRPGPGDSDSASSGAAGRARGRPGPDCIRARHV